MGCMGGTGSSETSQDFDGWIYTQNLMNYGISVI